MTQFHNLFDQENVMTAKARSMTDLKKSLADLPCARLDDDQAPVVIPVAPHLWQKVAAMLGQRHETMCCFLGQLTDAGASVNTEDGMLMVTLPDQTLKSLVPDLE